MPIDDGFTVALLHMNGPDASTVFIDEAGKTFTANGNAQIDTAQSKLGDASGLFDGTGDTLSSADSVDWQLDGGSNSNKWTTDFWARFNGDPGTGIQGFVQQRESASEFWSLFLNNNNLQIVIRTGGVAVVSIQNAWNPATATWYHVACVKNGTSGYMMFIDGTQIGTTQTDTDTMPNFAGGLLVADHFDSAGAHNYFNGWMDELRISKGIARWTANFTPPTFEYGNDKMFMVF